MALLGLWQAADLVAGDTTEFGGCYDTSTNSVTCAFNSSHCAAGTTWLTPGSFAGYGADSCWCADTPIGACYSYATTHVATCHMHESQCPDMTSWIGAGYEYADGSECTCASNRNSGMSQFGMCYDTTTHAATCSVSKADCTDDEMWFEPQEALNDYSTTCNCIEVETGGCYSSITHSTTCVVDSDSCDSDESWIDARTMRDTYGLSCTLCDSNSTLITHAPTAAPDPSDDAGAPEGMVEFGGCYDMTTHAVTCAFNSSHCDDSAVWLTPTTLASYSMACWCDITPVGACYDYMATRASSMPNNAMPVDQPSLSTHLPLLSRVCAAQMSQRATFTATNAPTIISGSAWAMNTPTAASAPAQRTATLARRSSACATIRPRKPRRARSLRTTAPTTRIGSSQPRRSTSTIPSAAATMFRLALVTTRRRTPRRVRLTPTAVILVPFG